MGPSRWGLAGYAVLLCVLSSAIFADEHDLREIAQAAYAEGQYATALRNYLALRQVSIESPILVYNIAVSAYRSGRYYVAKKEFENFSRSYGTWTGRRLQPWPCRSGAKQ